MFLIPTRIAPSGIHGIGVFAVAPIAAGTPVWRFTPGLDQEFDPAAIDRLAPHMREFFGHYGYLDRHRARIILCFDHARFVNHSDDPNLAPDYTRDPYGLDVALRDIAAGEELTMDYATFEQPTEAVSAVRGLS